MDSLNSARPRYVPFLLLAPIFVVVLQRSSIGRRIYAIGGALSRRSGLAGFSVAG